MVRLINVLEPAMTRRWEEGAFTLLGWKTDGRPAPAKPRRARRIELLGDSISAGYGSRGTAALNQVPPWNPRCPAPGLLKTSAMCIRVKM